MGPLGFRGPRMGKQFSLAWCQLYASFWPLLGTMLSEAISFPQEPLSSLLMLCVVSPPGASSTLTDRAAGNAFPGPWRLEGLSLQSRAAGSQAAHTRPG